METNRCVYRFDDLCFKLPIGYPVDYLKYLQKDRGKILDFFTMVYRLIFHSDLLMDDKVKY